MDTLHPQRSDPGGHRRPLVLINGELEEGEKRRLQLPVRYAEALWHAGANPVVLPPCTQDKSGAFLDTLLAQADGLVLSGADDFDTERLKLGPTHAAAKPVPTDKQDFDLALTRKALQRGLPTLGICYGMQLLGILSGSRLFQHLPEDRPAGQEHTGGVRHDVHLAPGTKLREIYGVDRISVISRHHQALASVGERWKAGAHDGEGLIEGIELEASAFAVGVQWHPELDDLAGPQAHLFRSFVEAASRSALGAGALSV
jgi:putative glutamine amidotransferase